LHHQVLLAAKNNDPGSVYILVKSNDFLILFFIVNLLSPKISLDKILLFQKKKNRKKGSQVDEINFKERKSKCPPGFIT
jgi:hypothetical protein